MKQNECLSKQAIGVINPDLMTLTFMIFISFREPCSICLLFLFLRQTIAEVMDTGQNPMMRN